MFFKTVEVVVCGTSFAAPCNNIIHLTGFSLSYGLISLGPVIKPSRFRVTNPALAAFVYNLPKFSLSRRYYSLSSSKIYFNNYDDITSEVLNNLLKNQQVSITEEELARLKTISGVRFDLPLNDQTYPSFVGLVGKPNTRGTKAGVYIFTHKATGSKYVGSSNSLSRRLDQYFTYKHFNQENSGLLLPLIKKDGFGAFNLEIFVVPEDFSHAATTYKLEYYYLFLEQYYLLNQEFNLNTQRIVNFRVNQGKAIYIYDLEGMTLYYGGKSLSQIKTNLGIHHATCTNCIKNGDSYLNFFRITDTPIEGASEANLSFPELVDLFSTKKEELLKTTSRSKFSKPIIIKKEDEVESQEFSSITAAVNFLKNKNIQANRDQITK